MGENSFFDVLEQKIVDLNNRKEGVQRNLLSGEWHTEQISIAINQALDELEKDHKYLLAGDVFTKDNIETYISYKRENEVSPMDLRPHPHEFNLYYDV